MHRLGPLWSSPGHYQRHVEDFQHVCISGVKCIPAFSIDGLEALDATLRFSSDSAFRPEKIFSAVDHRPIEPRSRSGAETAGGSIHIGHVPIDKDNDLSTAACISPKNAPHRGFTP